MARPYLYSNADITAALTATKGLVYLAARRLGCTPDTIYTRARKSPEVAACLKTQRGEIVDTGELALYNAVVRGESWAVQFLLKTLGKDRGYVERQEVTGRDGEAVAVTVVSGVDLGAVTGRKAGLHERHSLN